MSRLIKRWFSLKADPRKRTARDGKAGRVPLIVSFDGRVMRLRLPEG
ncbi:MAG: hypothetical protein IT489_08170 [Gammaproteobacteria bacterium]|nr:hypothetical protein [Gammaproteobacteria bacterium]